MKTRLVIIITLALLPLLISNSSALCAAEAIEWWESCNDAGQNDLFSFKATTMILVILAITGIVLIFFAVRKWKNKMKTKLL